jgi:hypothetical protein
VLSKVGSLAILLLHTYHEKNVARNYVTIIHINSVVQNSNIQNRHACLEAFIATKLKDFMVQNGVKYKLISVKIRRNIKKKHNENQCCDNLNAVSEVFFISP